MILNLIKKLPNVTIKTFDPTLNKETPYLTRYFLFLKENNVFNIYFHHFHTSDRDVGENNLGLLHNHPTVFSFSLILSGGYAEERLINNKIVVKTFKPLSFNKLKSDEFHRIDLLQNKCWTIFFTLWRPKNTSWYFYDRITKKNIPSNVKEGSIV